MAIKISSVYNSSGFPLIKENLGLEIQLGNQIEEYILNFIKNPPNIPERQYIIAHNQILSLYRRMKYHPENIVLCKFYENRIKQIIQLEKGKEK